MEGWSITVIRPGHVDFRYCPGYSHEGRRASAWYPQVLPFLGGVHFTVGPDPGEYHGQDAGAGIIEYHQGSGARIYAGLHGFDVPPP